MEIGPQLPYEESPSSYGDDLGFSLVLKGMRSYLGEPEEYAHGKARLFADEGGPAVLEVDVPQRIINCSDVEYAPPSQGIVVFDWQHGLCELLDVWSGLNKRIIKLKEARE